MTWSNRFRLWGGVAAVLVIMVLLTLLYNQRQSRVASVTATVDAPSALVGSNYAGVLTETFITAGQDVAAGDRLFTVVSPDVQNAVANGLNVADTAAYTVDEETGTVTYLAVIDGQVTDVAATAGSFVNSGTSLATIAASSPKTVVARFELEPVDYSRVETGARVIVNLADNTKLEGEVTDVSVVTDNGEAITVAYVTVPTITDAAYAQLTRAGSPVQAIMELRDDGLLAGPTQAFRGFLTQIGLR
ncbi:HlyD family efflux transporter periplasmic adaptor subunit [Propioniciclava soli]|uniref:HlyD family efflux transporter periplasmic adaptor subunit n=1 Tax=Propioniciclava soli TaxID=2775081 RepID=A0ABZ3CAV6_9ACTN|nr:HlyD family efflux transporter periplasmic adaptor subunit [Propioniciclava soli]